MRQRIMLQFVLYMILQQEHYHELHVHKIGVLYSKWLVFCSSFGQSNINMFRYPVVLLWDSSREL